MKAENMMKCISFIILFSLSLEAENQNFTFTFTSEGTMYPFRSVTTMHPDGRVVFIRSKPGSGGKIHEKWEGSLRKEDLLAFRQAMIVECGFFSLHGKPEYRISIKDSSWDSFTVTLGNRTHTVSGYALRQSKECQCLYVTYGELMKKIAGKRYIVKPR